MLHAPAIAPRGHGLASDRPLRLARQGSLIPYPANWFEGSNDMWQKLYVAWFVFLCFALTFPASAQKVNLEELEAQLMREQAKEAARRAAAAQGTLVVRADGDCALTVNGQAKGRLQADSTTTVKVSSGEQLIECDAGNGRRVEAIEKIASGEQKVVRLTLPPPERFTQVADGVEDNEQGIVWASSDNGSDIDWNGATSYCASKGAGWRLPTGEEARNMFDASGQFSQSQSNRAGNWTINPATSLIQFSDSAGFLWTSDHSGSSSAFIVNLINGIRLSFSVSDSYNLRALCVRRRS